AHRQQRGHEELWGLAGQRREPLYEQELVDTEPLAGMYEAVGERRSGYADSRRREGEERCDRQTSRRRRQSADGRGRSDQVRFAAAYGVKAGSWPALKAKTMSTAYSGRTASKAMVVIARARGMSCSAASAPQAMAKDAPTMAVP